MAAGDYASACPKLAESQRLDPGVGTLLNLGACYEKNGQTASAWVTFKGAAAAARAAQESDREEFARATAARLEPALARLSIDVPPGASTDGLVIEQDGQVLPPATWRTPVPVDPGEHVVEASAPGKKRFRQKVTVTAAMAMHVSVPQLETDDARPPVPAAPPAGVAPAAEAPSRARASASRVPVWGSYGAGAVGLAVGATFGALTLATKSTLDGNCTDRRCPPSQQSNVSTLSRDSWIANAGFGVAIVGAAVGTTLLVINNAHDTSTLRVTPTIGLGAVGVTGSFQ